MARVNDVEQNYSAKTFCVSCRVGTARIDSPTFVRQGCRQERNYGICTENIWVGQAGLVEQTEEESELYSFFGIWYGYRKQRIEK